MAHFTYQEMFAIITPALITGAFADRVQFKSYLKFLALWSLLVYVPVTHWVWGGGFLQQWGVLDFAGGMVVHITAGMAALASVWVVGRRHFAKGERFIPHSIAFVGLGTALLWFGWFGFNGGSALAANGIAAQAFVNTDIAGSIAMCTWLFISWRSTASRASSAPSPAPSLDWLASPLAPATSLSGQRSSSASWRDRSATSPSSSSSA